ncbi:MAG: hypothetical protein HYX37_10165 [Rhizobiales bacterium]|nr:hypothetical protein [Hyphomicrobiales bacterium]
MQEAKTYRQYAAECVRMAQKLSAKDKDVLLQMAEAWELPRAGGRTSARERQEKIITALSNQCGFWRNLSRTPSIILSIRRANYLQVKPAKRL